VTEVFDNITQSMIIMKQHSLLHVTLFSGRCASCRSDI